MKVVVDIITIVIACCVAYMVYVFAVPGLRYFGMGKKIQTTAFIMAMLALLAILDLGKGAVALLLIPYAALGITFLALFLIGLSTANAKWSFHQPNRRWQQAARKIVVCSSQSIRRAWESILERLPR